MRKIALPLLTTLFIIAAAAVWWFAWHRNPPAEPASPVRIQAPPGPKIPYEQWARQEFERNHPGGKPLNWKIAETAEAYVQAQPMGKFVLYSNDCSDFADSVLDDALGLRARFRRNSKYHLAAVDNIWQFFDWEPGISLIPGDEINVRHSPHYPPSSGEVRHCGVVGPDGMVYDWTKLKRWRTHRYGRHSVAWFTQNARGAHEITVRRLLPQYRYMIEPVPHISETKAATVQ